MPAEHLTGQAPLGVHVFEGFNNQWPNRRQAVVLLADLK